MPSPSPCIARASLKAPHDQAPKERPNRQFPGATLIACYFKNVEYERFQAAEMARALAVHPKNTGDFRSRGTALILPPI
jgi:hypothetical protein